jgi:hypothetical protein
MVRRELSQKYDETAQSKMRMLYSTEEVDAYSRKR